MISEEKINLLQSFIDSGINPIMIKEINSNIFKNSVILKNDIPLTELNGHYEEMKFVSPNWYQDLTNKCKSKYAILLIEDINNIKEEDQIKFVEILKYKKISTFEIPKNCLIIVTAKNKGKFKISKEIYSLVASI